MSDLKAALAAVARVKGALDASAGGTFSCYLLRAGTLTATSRGMAASAPFPWAGDALVPGAEFEAVLSRSPDDPTFVLGGGKLVVRAKRFKGTVPALPGADLIEARAPDALTAVPLGDDFLGRLRALLPFVSDEPEPAWTNALIVQRGRASAVGPGGSMYAMTAIPDLGRDSALIPKNALALALASSPAPATISLTEVAAAFHWPDGGWLRTGLISGLVPAAIDRLAEAALAGTSAPPITDEWREAFGRVAGFARGEVAFFADRIVAREGDADAEDGAETPVPEGRDCSLWSVVLARVVVERATRWDPSAYPAPAPFASDLIRGLVTGRSR